MKKIFRFKFYWLVLPILLFMGGCAGKTVAPGKNDIQKVGFDIDDTLLFSTPAFQEGFNSGAKQYSEEFWVIVNGVDREKSIVKKRAEQILEMHKKKGDLIYVITSREPYGAENLKIFLYDRFGVPLENIYFESDKTGRIKELGLNIYYGDSDSDIKAALEAGAIPYRIQRARESSYKNKYNPGSYGENIIEGSEW